jgi:hypothetical protein
MRQKTGITLNEVIALSNPSFLDHLSNMRQICDAYILDLATRTPSTFIKALNP